MRSPGFKQTSHGQWSEPWLSIASQLLAKGEQAHSKKAKQRHH